MDRPDQVWGVTSRWKNETIVSWLKTHMSLPHPCPRCGNVSRFRRVDAGALAFDPGNPKHMNWPVECGGKGGQCGYFRPFRDWIAGFER